MSVLSGAPDGRNVIQFEDPFSEVEDLVNCQGVLARGGYSAAGATTGKKQRKSLGKALRFLTKTDRAITKGIPGECGVGMHALVADLRARTTTVPAGIP